MAEHLLLVTLGPVQEFIQKARRTRDLWFGSHLLSEVSRAAARSIVEEPGERPVERQPARRLILPALDALDPELRPCPRLFRDRGQQQVSPIELTNRILALLPDGVDPEATAREARAAANEQLREIARDVKARLKTALAPEIDRLWEEQIGTFLEFAAAWTVVVPGDYRGTRVRLDETLAARKSLRDFPAWRETRSGAPKSSLDGARDSVLAKERQGEALEVLRRYRIGEGEQLDAIGLVKRAGAEPEQFVPIANVALAAWIERAVKHVGSDVFEQLQHACRDARIGWVARADLPWVNAFPFDAQVFLESRWSEVLRESGWTERADEAKRWGVQQSPGDARSWGVRHVKEPILDRMHAPFPYVACLVADGDRMGRALRGMSDWERHRKYSRALSRFVGGAREVVEQQHRGVLIYAGGDDLLALVCLPDALRCVAGLRDEFARVMAAALPGVDETTRPTLSVGLGVAHFIESLGDLLDLGRRAEKLAKGDGRPVREQRDALAIMLEKRAGVARSWRERWTHAPVERLEADLALLTEGPSGSRLAARRVHEVLALIRRSPEPVLLTAGERATWASLIERDVRRTLARSDDGAGVTPEDVGLELGGGRGGDYDALRGEVLRWVDRLLIAGELAAARASLQPRRWGE